MTPKYRRDIDGLRAIAVLPVVLFHADFDLFSGGYVGVDIFFVISGFLITSIIVKEISTNNFSIILFYERRFRRIFPALTVVIFSSFIAGILLLRPTQLSELGQSAIATALFSSNILFYFESDYFDTASEFKPLLHTWSLAIEEQYYILMPALLIIISKIKPNRYWVSLLIISLISFVISVVEIKTNPSAAFYLIPSRAWELLVGSILALPLLPKTSNKYITNLLSILGILLIGICVFSYTKDTQFPSVSALLPTMGTAMIIYSGLKRESTIGKILGFKPIVFIGLISYSLYLWHWPIIVYTKYYFIRELTETESSIMICMVFILSILSWQFIEKPFRKKKVLAKQKNLLIMSFTTSLIIISTATLLVYKQGFPYRVPNENSHFVDLEWQHWTNCADIKNKEKLCNIGYDKKQPNFILWGDSHAKSLASSIDLVAKKNKASGKIAFQTACPPLYSIERPNRLSCQNFNQSILNYLSNHPEINTVILAARWSISINGTRYKKETGKPVQLIDLLDEKGNKNAELFSIGLNRTIEELKRLGKKIILVMPIPEIGYDVPSALFVSTITQRDVSSIISPTKNEYLQRVEKVRSLFYSLETKKHIQLIDPSKYLCDQNSCQVIMDNIPLYRDDDHLSTFGSIYVSPLFDNVFKQLN